MREFSSAQDYVIAASGERNLACVPFQVAADALRIGRGAVEARVRSGKLDAVKIERTRYIIVSSIKRQIDEWEDEIGTITKLLESEAAKGTKTLPYNPVMGAVGRKTTIPNDRTVIGAMLGAISKRSFGKNGFLLTAMVVRNGSGQPSPAFYALANELDPGYQVADTDLSYHEDQIHLIQAYYNPQHQS